MSNHFVRRHLLAAYWLLFAVLAIERGRDPGFVPDHQLQSYPWKQVLVTCILLAAAAAVLHVILRPTTFHLSWRRLHFALAYAVLLFVLSALTYGADQPGYYYVLAWFSATTLAGLLGFSLLMWLQALWQWARTPSSKVKEAELKSREEAERRYRQKTIDDALALTLPDGVFRIVLYNSLHSNRAPEKQIDPFDVFSSSSRDEVDDWIRRSRILMSSNYEVGDALVGKKANFEAIKDKYISSNPGFSRHTYAHAIHMGASKAVR